MILLHCTRHIDDVTWLCSHALCHLHQILTRLHTRNGSSKTMVMHVLCKNRLACISLLFNDARNISIFLVPCDVKDLCLNSKRIFCCMKFLN